MSYNSFEKLVISSRYFLLGMAELNSKYLQCVKALEFGLQHHQGTRNGGKPEFIHQLEIFQFLRTHHKSLVNPEIAYTLSFLHDVVEDKMVSLKDIEMIFGELISQKVDLLTKEYKITGKKKDFESYIQNVFADIDTSVVKMADRCNNVSSMFGVFKPERLQRYVTETREVFLPKIKSARRLFPEQESVYENGKLVLIHNLQLIEGNQNVQSE